MENSQTTNDFGTPPPVKPLANPDPHYYQPESGNGFIKAVVFVLVIAVVVAIGYFGISRSKQANQNQEDQTVKPTDIPPSIISVLSVYAAGNMINETYPNLEVYVNNELVKTVENVKGDIKNSVFDVVEYSSENKILPEQVSIRTTNMNGKPATNKGYLYIEKINIDGTDYLSDDPKVYTTYTEAPATFCVSGQNRSKWLYCNGYLTFGGDQPATGGILPTPTIGLSGNVIKVYAAGTAVDGVYPTMKLVVNGEHLATFNNVKGDVAKRLMQEFSHTYSGPVLGRVIQIEFINDAYKTPQDRNLYIDHLNFNGVDYYPESESVYSTGTWTGGGCASGNTRIKQLNCNGYMQFKTPVQ